MMVSPSYRYRGVALGVTLMVTPLLSLSWFPPSCHFDGVALDVIMMMITMVSL